MSIIGRSDRTSTVPRSGAQKTLGPGDVGLALLLAASNAFVEEYVARF